MPTFEDKVLQRGVAMVLEAVSRRTRDSNLTWERFNLLLKRYPLPNLRICHAA
jgi:hypothetical protein